MKQVIKNLYSLLFFILIGFTSVANTNPDIDPYEVVYPAVKIKNNTAHVVTGKVYYASIWVPIKGQLCKNDTYTIQPWGTWSHKRGECLITKITSTVNGKSASSYTSSGTSYSTFQVTVTSKGYRVYRTGKDWDEKVTDGLTKVYSNSVDLVNDAAKRSKNATEAIAKNTEKMAEKGIETTSSEFKSMSKEAEKQLKGSLEFVEDVAVAGYEWAEKNGCQFVVNTGISAVVVANFTPKSPADPGTAASASMMATAASFWADAISQEVAAQSIAYIATESFMLIPGVKGNIKKSLLQNVIANSVSGTLDCIPCFGTPTGVGIVMAANISPIISELICSRVIPKGYSKELAIVNTMPNYPTPPPPTRPTTTPSGLNNGTYMIQQKSNLRFLDAYESSDDYSAVTRTAQNDNSQKWVFTAIGNDLYTIQQKSTMRYLDAHESSNDYSIVTRTAQNNSSQRWVIKKVGDNSYTIQQKVNMRFWDAHESSSYSAVTRTAQNNNSQKWVITFVKPTPPNAANFDKTTIVQLKNFETKRLVFSTGDYGEEEKGWLQSPDVVGSDANYYNRANWYLIKNGTGYMLRNQETYRYLFSTGDPVKGSEGGWLKSPAIVGTDATYYNRAIWDLEKQPNGSYLLKNRETKRYLFSAGDPVKAAEGGWLKSPAVLGTDGNYYNRALWTITGSGTKLLPK